MDWKEDLVKQAKRKRMCDENFRAVLACRDKRSAIKLYKKTIDWALESDYPSLTSLRAHFADQEENGLFVDRSFKGEVLDKHQCYVFHNCTGTIKVAMDYENEIIPMLYFANDCHIAVSCEQDNIKPIAIPLYLFGENIVSIDADSYGAVFTKHYIDLK